MTQNTIVHIEPALASQKWHNIFIAFSNTKLNIKKQANLTKAKWNYIKYSLRKSLAKSSSKVLRSQANRRAAVLSRQQRKQRLF